jgi:mannose-6-phosphate isomerase
MSPQRAEPGTAARSQGKETLPDLVEPLLFEPFLRAMVWGGRRLGEQLGKRLPGEGPYGESWEVSDHALHRSLVARGPAAGTSLRTLMERSREALLGPTASRHAAFPWLVKLLDARDWLSVQVHPDEDTVRRLWPGEGSKTEAWFILDADPGSRIWAGLLPGVDENAVRTALAHGKVADCLHSFAPRPGDCVFLPAGAVHAVGGGVLMAEIQQTSDATFRLFDWDRRDAQGKPRALHIEESLASIHWDQGPVLPLHVAEFAPPGKEGEEPRERSTRRTELVRCGYFHLDHVSGSEPFTVGGTGALQMLLVLGGRGWLDGSGGAEPLTAGQAWVLPAGGLAVPVRPHLWVSCLLCTLPA